MEKNNVDLGSGKVSKLILNLALPAIAAQIVNLLYNVVDRIYIGHIPGVGADALTGVGVCMPIILLISAFAALAAMGGSPRASILLGKQDKAGAEKVLGNCTALLLIISVVLTVVFQIFKENILYFVGASESTIGYAVDYITIYIYGTMFVQLALGLNTFISCQGFAKINMITVIIGAVLNIILDPVFIFLFDLGVKGAAIATVISQAVSAFWVVRFLTGKKSVLKLKRENMKLKKDVFLPCVLLGMAPFIMQGTESIISMCFNASLQRYGGDIAVGSMTILYSAMQFSMMPLMGLTQGAQPVTSYNFGAKNYDRVRSSVKCLLVSSVVYAAVIWGICMFFPQLIIKMFTSETALIAYTKSSLRIYMAVMVLMGVQLACQQTFIAIGNAKTSLFLALLRKVFLLIPLVYILPQFISPRDTAVFLAEPIADFIAVTTTAVMFAIQFKKAVPAQKSLPQGE